MKLKSLEFIMRAVFSAMSGRRVAKPEPKKRITIPESGVLLDVSIKRGKIRRNGPCPCGMGDKFKHCHLPRIRNGEFERVTPKVVGERLLPVRKWARKMPLLALKRGPLRGLQRFPE